MTEVTFEQKLIGQLTPAQEQMRRHNAELLDVIKKTKLYEMIAAQLETVEKRNAAMNVVSKWNESRNREAIAAYNVRQYREQLEEIPDDEEKQTERDKAKKEYLLAEIARHNPQWELHTDRSQKLYKELMEHLSGRR